MGELRQEVSDISGIYGSAFLEYYMEDCHVV